MNSLSLSLSLSLARSRPLSLSLFLSLGFRVSRSRSSSHFIVCALFRSRSLASCIRTLFRGRRQWPQASQSADPAGPAWGEVGSPVEAGPSVRSPEWVTVWAGAAGGQGYPGHQSRVPGS